MNDREYGIAKKLKERLSQVADLVDFRIFGSRATGNGSDYSDMDVFLVVDSLTKELKEKIFEIVWEVGFENFIVISPLIFTKEEMESSPLRSSPIVRNISKEGVRI